MMNESCKRKNDQRVDSRRRRKRSEHPRVHEPAHLPGACPIELREGQLGSLPHQPSSERRDEQHDNEPFLADGYRYLASLLLLLSVITHSGSV